MKFKIEIVSKPEDFSLDRNTREFARPQKDFSLVLEDPLENPELGSESWCFDVKGDVDVASLGFQFEQSKEYDRIFLPRNYQPWGPNGEIVVLQGWSNRLDRFSVVERTYLRSERVVGLRSFAFHPDSGTMLVGRGTPEGMEWECFSPNGDRSVRLRPETVRSSGIMAAFWTPRGSSACLFDPGDCRRRLAPALIFVDPDSGTILHREELDILADEDVIDAEYDYCSSILRISAKIDREFFVRVGARP